MYLQKDRNCTFYTRVSLPIALSARGLPRSIRLSLRTKDRKEAINRNLSTAHFLRSLIMAIPTNFTRHQFNVWLTSQIVEFRNNGYTIEKQVIAKVNEGDVFINSSNTFCLTQSFKQFLESKSVESITQRTLAQLKLRVGYFVTWAAEKDRNPLSSQFAFLYRNHLLQLDKSFKTKSDYLSAAKQFLGWCQLSGYTKNNPFNNIKLGKKPIQIKKSEERKRWSVDELQILFSEIKARNDRNRTQHKYADFFIPLLSLFAGLRISEAAQIRLSSIKCEDGIYYIDVNHADELNPLKTANAYRKVPLHDCLIQFGLLRYVRWRNENGFSFLFDEQSNNCYNEWSKAVCLRFHNIIKKLDIGDNSPTLYGLRHTFIEELQQMGVQEHVVAELVGHTKQGITFGRYGKQLNLSLLKEKVDLVPNFLGCTPIFIKNLV